MEVYTQEEDPQGGILGRVIPPGDPPGGILGRFTPTRVPPRVGGELYTQHASLCVYLGVFLSHTVGPKVCTSLILLVLR